ncbi:MAG: ribonuclease Z [Deltaproteobacteria bacterium]|nr:MAG: ribonuclease Z [Deltaproteobacteria bacterium]RLB10106.1 MAG: ribonuclease Z [Deltaproteobacteria bacterium]
MRPNFKPRLVNGPFGDPAVYLEFLRERRAFLFDLGDLRPLTNRELLKISHVFVSHTHVDHFIGFDHLLRISLGRQKQIVLFGPNGIIDNVEGKLRGYTWNLVENYVESLSIKVYQVEEKEIEVAKFSCRERFKRQHLDAVSKSDNILLDEPSLTVCCTFVNHLIPVLAFSFEEKYHINVKKNELEKRNWPPGPWLAELKQAIYEDRPDDWIIQVRSPRTPAQVLAEVPLGELRHTLVMYTAGQKISYVTDMLFEPESVQRVIELVSKSNLLYIEACFLEEDREIASEKYHLTAAQAGYIAGKAKVQNFKLFHFSPKYKGREIELIEEARDAYKKSLEK